jgi:hypothetical protein
MVLNPNYNLFNIFYSRLIHNFSKRGNVKYKMVDGDEKTGWAGLNFTHRGTSCAYILTTPVYKMDNSIRLLFPFFLDLKILLSCSRSANNQNGYKL